MILFRYIDKKWISREQKVEAHLSIKREENVSVYKPVTPISASTRVIVHLPEPKQTPQLYNMNKNIPHVPPKILDQQVLTCSFTSNLLLVEFVFFTLKEFAEFHNIS